MVWRGIDDGDFLAFPALTDADLASAVVDLGGGGNASHHRARSAAAWRGSGPFVVVMTAKVIVERLLADGGRGRLVGVKVLEGGVIALQLAAAVSVNAVAARGESSKRGVEASPAPLRRAPDP